MSKITIYRNSHSDGMDEHQVYEWFNSLNAAQEGARAWRWHIWGQNSTDEDDEGCKIVTEEHSFENTISDIVAFLNRIDN